MVLNLTFVCVDFLYGIALFIKFTLPRQFWCKEGGQTLSEWDSDLHLQYTHSVDGYSFSSGLGGGHVTTNQHVIARDMMLQYKLLFSVRELEALTLTCFFPDDKPTKQ